MAHHLLPLPLRQQQQEEGELINVPFEYRSPEVKNAKIDRGIYSISLHNNQIKYIVISQSMNI